MLMIANRGGARVVKEDRFKDSKGEGRLVEVEKEGSAVAKVDEGRIAGSEGGRQVRSFEEDWMKVVGKK